MKTFRQFTVTGVAATVLAVMAAVTSVAQPTILTQPKQQWSVAGSNVTFSVTATTGAPPELPSVSSGSLRLWLEADAGVSADGAGLVSDWQDQSGNGNDATQSDDAMKPSLVYPAALAGKPALQFNGTQDGVNGSLLQGTGDVGTPDQMTAFTVYNAYGVSNTTDIAWLIGSPGAYGASRGLAFYYGELDFTTWSYDYTPSYTGPLNTYRVCTDRLNSALTTLEVFDSTLTTSNGFSFSMYGTQTPDPGYSVGGISFRAPDNFYGEVAEVIIYQGYLTDGDRLAVEEYLKQKYLKEPITNGLAYQWRFNSADIGLATNSTLTVTNAQSTNAGSYSVMVSDNDGRTLSSNALLTIGTAPAITWQPRNQEVKQGDTAFFTVTNIGTGPWSYQWYFDGAPLANATDATLNLPNAQSNNVGVYTVVVSTPFGSATSSNATLAVDFRPIIAVQPQSQNVTNGGTISLAVTASGSFTVSTPPAVASGTLRLWLEADAGVVADSNNRVSLWQDQSGNANDVGQSDTAMQPTSVADTTLAGKPVVRFNGIQDKVNGSMLSTTADINIPNALTAFTVYNVTEATNNANILWFIGVPGEYGAGRGHSFVGGELNFTTWSYDYSAPYVGPLGVYRICTDRVDTNLSEVEIFDNTAGSATNFSYSMHDASAPAPGFTVGGIHFAAPDNFNGAIAEIICYKGQLTDMDRLAVLGYLEQKYFFGGGGPSLAYQWRFDGAPIAGATNRTLTITNAQATNYGSYTVAVSNLAGGTLSSNALIMIGDAPSITNAPAGVGAVPGSPADFSVGASGTQPLSYQWQFNGTNIPGATATNYVVNSVTLSNLGAYSVVVSNGWASVTSAPALLELNPQISVNGVVGTNFSFTNVASVQVQMATTFAGGSIFYTLDGSTPDFGGAYYGGPFGLSQSAIIRAAAYDQDFNAAQSVPVTVNMIISNTLTVVNPGGGSVALNPPGGVYRSTQSVQLTATASNGWTFIQWSGAVSSANPVITLPMMSNQTVRAIFGSPFVVTPPANGSIQFDPPLGMFPYGSTVEIYAVPAKGYYFALWGGGVLSGIANPYAFTMTKTNPPVSAAFSALSAGRYSLTVIPNGNGGSRSRRKPPPTQAMQPCNSSPARKAPIIFIIGLATSQARPGWCLLRCARITRSQPISQGGFIRCSSRLPPSARRTSNSRLSERRSRPTTLMCRRT